MKNKIIYLPLLILAGAALTTNVAQASESSQNLKPKPVVQIVQNERFVSIPLDTDLKVYDAADLDLDLSDEFETDYISKIEYDIFGNIDAKLGLIKTKNVKSRYRTRPAIHPRGHYFKPLNSKLGAGVSSKF